MKQIKLTIGLMLLATILFGQQVPLNTQLHALSGMVFKTRAKSFNNVFKPKNGSFAACVTEHTSFKQIRTQLEDKLIPPAASQKYFKVLRILYGLDTTNSVYSIRLIYLPDIAKATTQFEYEFSVRDYPLKPEQTIYLLNSTTGDFVAEAYSVTASKLVFNYQDTSKGTIILNEYGDPGKHYLRKLSLDFTDPNKDAEGTTFSFQEINAFVADAPHVYFTSVPEKDEVHGNNFYKHAVAFSGSHPDAIASDDQYAADLGALCPLRCKGVNLQTTISGQMGVGASFWGDDEPKTLFLKWLIPAGIAVLFLVIGIFLTKANFF